MAALNSAKQRHPTVPSSNNPPIPEWAPHYWYILRCAALQAHPDNNDNTAVHLVNFFASMTVVTPCPECREHYVEDWLVEPFTMAHARHTDGAMRWVEDLRLKVEARVKAKMGTVPPIMTHVAAGDTTTAAAAEGDSQAHQAHQAHTAQARTAPLPRQTPRSHHFQTTAAPPPVAPKPRPSFSTQAAVRGAPAESSHTAALRTYAIRASLLVTAANHSGRRMGCNCPAKTKTTANSATRVRPPALPNSSFRRR